MMFFPQHCSLTFAAPCLSYFLSDLIGVVVLFLWLFPSFCNILFSQFFPVIFSEHINRIPEIFFLYVKRSIYLNHLPLVVFIHADCFYLLSPSTSLVQANWTTLRWTAMKCFTDIYWPQRINLWWSPDLLLWHHEVDICGFKGNVTTTIDWIAMIFGPHMHASLRGFSDCFNDPILWFRPNIWKNNDIPITLSFTVCLVLIS